MTVHWGLAGCGDIAHKRIVPALASDPQSKLISVMHPNFVKGSAFAETHQIADSYLSMEDMVKDDAINAVYVATPIHLHHGQVLAALAAGKHVLVEKPMALNVRECNELIAMAENRNVRLGVAYYRRFFPKLEEARRIIREGLIGEVIQARILYHAWYNPTGNQAGAWRTVKALSGGGPLWDMGSHKLDLLVSLLGMPKSVMALKNTLTHQYEVEDSCSVLLELENRAQCLVSFNWNSKVWADELEILGTEGKLVMNPCDSDRLELWQQAKKLKGAGKEVTLIFMPNCSNVHEPLIAEFTAAVIEGRPPLVSGREGIKASRILEAIEESAVLERKIWL